MIRIITRLFVCLLFIFTFILPDAFGQATSISGKITETESGEGLPGVNILIKGTVSGTITDIDGNFNLSTDVPVPLTIAVSYIGFKTQEIEITDANTTGLELQMEEQTLLGQEIVISASRVEESILQSPVTIEKLDILAIQQSAAPSFYDQLDNIKGVQTSKGSLTFNALNTRGFATIANIRFVALIDGMDISAPLLNFPTGNLVGLSGLDAESVELVPGAASALYGPNAFNGILFMNSKSPFEYQGLSAQVKLGATDSDAAGTDPLYHFALRYAKAFNNKFAFKVNFNLLQATDWAGNDYTTDRIIPGNQVGAPNFDGMNLYGDETRIIIPAALTGLLGPLDIRRTGIQEEQLLGNEDAKAIKASAALHYRFNDKIEGIYNYRYGGGSTIYQGSAKFVLRDFIQQFHKLEVKGDNFFVRGYRTETDDGDSYNLDAMGAFVNEAISPTATVWAPTYAQGYVLALQGFIPGVPAGNIDAAHDYGRFAADNRSDAAGNLNPVTAAELQSTINTVRNLNLQIDAGGAGFIEGSRLWHGEFNYNFKNQIEVVEIQVGGNVRRYDIWSAGTIFDELQADGSFDRVVIDEWGIYTQLSKRFNDLKISGSIRFDKNEHFEGQFNPRLAAVYTINDNHNIRASFQTGFRNPDTQSQFIWFPTSQGILVGSTEANAARYNLHNGGSYTSASVSTFLTGGGSFDASGNTIGGTPSDLQTATFGFVEPEQLTAIELGYKGVIADKLLLDVNWYRNSYEDFIAQFTVFNKLPVMRADGSIATGVTGDTITAFRPYVNAQETITSNGVGVGLTYSIGGGYSFTGNYNWTDFELDDIDIGNELEAGFNTPEHKFGVGVHNRDVGYNIGFSLNYRWQDDFFWESAFGKGIIPDFGVIDFQVNYTIKSLKSVIKLGSTNLLGGDFRTNIGPGYVGSQYYISITYDEFLH